MAKVEVRVRAREPRDAEAIAEILACPRVVAGTLQLPLRSVEVVRERLAHQGQEVHSLVAEVEGTARDYAFRNGAYVDALMMARLKT